MVYEKQHIELGTRMAEVSTDELRQAVESERGGAATFVQAVPVREEHNGQTIWDGTVHVFDLRGSTSGAFRVYAWPYEHPDGKRGVFAMLHTPQVKGPREAVAAAIVAEARTSSASK